MNCLGESPEALLLLPAKTCTGKMENANCATRTILFGHFGWGNIGNDSSLEAALNQIRKYRHQTELVCVCSSPKEIGERYGIRTLPIDMHAERQRVAGGTAPSRIKRIFRRVLYDLRFWHKYPSWFQPGDRLIVLGTGAVDDMATPHPWGAPYDLFKWCKAAKLGGAQVLFLNVGVGPISNRVSRILMLRALAMADYRSYREKAAFEYLHSVQVQTTGDLLYPDLVFGLRKDAGPVALRTTVKQVGVGLINYRGWHPDPRRGEAIYHRYRENIQAFISWLLDKGFIVRIVSGDMGDRRTVSEVEACFRQLGASPGELIVEPINTADDLLAQIARTDIVIASRFHNVLSALLLGIPVISVGYHDKNVNLMSEMGLENYCQHIEEFSVERLVQQFEACLVERDQAVARIRDKTGQYQRMLNEQFQRIFEPGGTWARENIA